jgi:hypothetical protein
MNSLSDARGEATFPKKKRGGIKPPPRRFPTGNYWLIGPPILSPPFIIFTLMT